MTTYIDELKNKNKSLNKTIKDSKKELEKLKKELEELSPQNGTLTFNDSNSYSYKLDDYTYTICSKATLTEASFPILIETKNENFEITLEDICKIRTLLDKKAWYKRVWEVIQKIWKKETKN